MDDVGRGEPNNRQSPTAAINLPTLNTGTAWTPQWGPERCAGQIEKEKDGFFWIDNKRTQQARTGSLIEGYQRLLRQRRETLCPFSTWPAAGERRKVTADGRGEPRRGGGRWVHKATQGACDYVSPKKTPRCHKLVTRLLFRKTSSSLEIDTCRKCDFCSESNTILFVDLKNRSLVCPKESEGIEVWVVRRWLMTIADSCTARDQTDNHFEFRYGFRRVSNYPIMLQTSRFWYRVVRVQIWFCSDLPRADAFFLFGPGSRVQDPTQNLSSGKMPYGVAWNEIKLDMGRMVIDLDGWKKARADTN